MNVYRISKCKYINDLSGLGAATFPGRWNSKGTYVLYTAATASLALLENVVHIPSIPTESYCMASIQVPSNSITDYNLNDLPKNWSSYPAPEILKSIGDAFIRANKKLGLKLPSAIIPEDFIILLNPLHLSFKEVKISSVRSLEFDKRLLKPV